MILTGLEIIKQVNNGSICIEPFEEGQVNPNSYNYKLGNSIIEVNTPFPQDRREKLIQQTKNIPEEGLTLLPDRYYLSSTYEKIGSDHFVPILIGRSSIGRLGLFLQISADLGNLGALHSWTLELKPCVPIVVYPRMIIGQVSFWAPVGSISLYEEDIGFVSNPTFRV